MKPEQMQKIVDDAPEWAKYVRKTKWMTHYSESHLVGSTSIEKLRDKLNKHNTVDSSDIQHVKIVLEK